MLNCRKERKKCYFRCNPSSLCRLTPEEWVRQHFVHFLLAHKGYPQALMANEVQVQLNGYKRNAVIQCSIDATLLPG